MERYYSQFKLLCQRGRQIAAEESVIITYSFITAPFLSVQLLLSFLSFSLLCLPLVLPFRAVPPVVRNVSNPASVHRQADSHSLQ